jgi:uncharacterized protein (TIGR02594 family)
MMTITAFELAQRFVGTREVPGSKHNSQILAMLHLDNTWPQGDEVPWCSAFANYIAWLLRLPRSKNLQAQSWLGVGVAIELVDCRAAFDVVVLSRGTPPGQLPPGQLPPGHVGFYAGHTSTSVSVLGGNQSDSVSVAGFPLNRVLGYRRLYDYSPPVGWPGLPPGR